MSEHMVLAADDDPTILDYFRKLLVNEPNDDLDILGESKPTTASYDYRPFTSPIALLEFYRNLHAAHHAAPLAILDMRMPAMNGLEAAVRLREIDPHINIVICSAYSDKSVDRIAEVLDTSVYFVNKPFNPNEFRLLVRSIVTGWRHLRNLDRSRAELERVLEATRTATWQWEIGSNRFMTSPRWSEITGYTMEEVLEGGLSFLADIVHPEDRPRLQKAVEQHFSSAVEYYDCEFRVRHRDGHWVWVHDRGKVVERDEDQKPLRMAGTRVDISERKRADAELVRSKNRFQQLAEIFPETLFETDLDGTITYINDHGISKFGHPRSGTTPALTLFDLVVPEQQSAARKHFSEKLERSSNDYFECKAVRRDGSTFDAIGLAAPIEVDGAITGLRGFLLDISKTKRAEAELRANNRTLEEAIARADALAREAAVANRAKSQFLATMSHEIRTPMNGVLGMMALLLDTDLTAEQRSFAEIARTSGEVMLALINGILDLSKIEAGKLELSCVDFEPATEVGAVLLVVGVQAREKGLALKGELAPDVPARVRGDPIRWRQVLLNLASNAVKFTPRGEVSLAVYLQSTANGQHTLRTVVRDTGIGIPKQSLGDLFQPFSQVDGSMNRKFGGTGLGLSISKQLCELMGGTIGVSSQEGAGSTFWFTAVFSDADGAASPQAAPALPPESASAMLAALPAAHHRPSASQTTTAAAPDPSPTPAPRPPAPPTPPSSGTQLCARETVLLVEDNPTNRLVALKILEKLGYAVAAVNDGREALAALRERRYAIVLMDCQMPEMDGFEATRAIRAGDFDVLDRAVPILAMTANAMEGDRERCLVAGMNGYLAKPISPAALRTALSKWLPPPIPSSRAGGGPPRSG